jgi:hypothetical protein
MSHVRTLSQEALDKATEEAELHEGELTQAATRIISTFASRSSEFERQN